MKMILNFFKKILSSGGRAILMTLLFLGVYSCIKYIDDSGFPLAIESYAAETLLEVNGKTCQDIKNAKGRCSYSGVVGETLRVKLPYRDKSYTFNLVCSKDANLGFSEDIKGGENFEFEIPIEDYTRKGFFICTGISTDMGLKTADFFTLTIGARNSEYVRRSNITVKYVKKGVKKGYLIKAGQYAFLTYVCNDRACKTYKRKPEIFVRSNKNLKIRSVSRYGRWSSYGY